MALEPRERVCEEACRQASTETLERIRSDKAGVSARLKPLLEHLEEHLFDPQLNVNQMRRRCGVRDNSVLTQFHHEVGETPYGYISGRRLEVAARLLADSRLWLWEVAATVGYASLTSFSRAFYRHFGMRPRQYRASASTAAGAPRSNGAVKKKAARRENGARLFRQALAGRLEEEGTRTLEEKLESTYKLAAGPSRPGRGLESFEQVVAQRLWRSIEPLEAAEQAERVRSTALGFRSAALFHLLREKSRSEGRKDRVRGVHLAKLAVESLEASAPFLGSRLHDLQAQGWAWVGNAYRLLSNFTAAEKAFLRADAAWSTPRLDRDRTVEAELLAYKASLRQYQCRFDEAIELGDLAIPILEEQNRTRRLAQTLIFRAGLAWHTGETEGAFRDLHKAQTLLDGEDPPLLTLMTYENLASLLTQECRFEEASIALGNAKVLCNRLRNPLIRHRLIWIEGLLMQKMDRVAVAERLLREARDGFLQLAESAYVAFVAIDLAYLCLRQQRYGEVIRLAAEALPLIESFQVKPESLTALRMLLEAAKSGHVNQASEKILTRLIANLRTDPTLPPRRQDLVPKGPGG